jgi:competence protein ComEC
MPEIKEPVSVNGFFTSYPSENGNGSFRQSFTIKSGLGVESGERFSELSGREMVLFSERIFDPYRDIELVLKIMKSRKRLNPGEQTSEKIHATLVDVRGVGAARMSLHGKIEEYRHRINNYIEEHFGEDSGALIASITTGERTGMKPEVKEAFNATGLAHILSISGTHFGLFSVLLFGMFRFLMKMLPYGVLQRITLYLTPAQAAAMLCLPFMLAYLGLSGASIPAVRSFLMITLFLVGLIIGRKGFWLNSLLFAAFVLVIWEPEVLMDLSFQLSFLAVMCIGGSLHSRKEENGEEEKRFTYFRNAFLMTLAVSIGTAPLVAYYFHYFSMISPISNLLIAPLIGFILIPLSVVSCFVFLATGHFIFAPLVSGLSDLSILLVKLLSEIPYADVKVPAFPPVLILFFYSGLLFYFLFQRRRYLLLIPFIPMIMYVFLSAGEKDALSVTFLDVGQGDASVIELPDGKTMMIDTGKTGREAASFLQYRGKEVVDILALSHIHPDHTGGLESITKKFEVREIWTNSRMILPDALNQVKGHSLNRGDLVDGEGYHIYVLHPYKEFYTTESSEYVEANNDSLVLKIEGDTVSFLFTGDIEKEAEEDILYLGKWIMSDVMKVPHHGGKTSADGNFFRAVSPDIAVISSGRDNPFGHPHQETTKELRDTDIFRTDLDGAIHVKESGKGLEVRTYREFQFKKARSFTDELHNVRRLFKTW